MATMMLTTLADAANAKTDSDKYARIVNIIVHRLLVALDQSHIAVLSVKHD